MSVMSGRSRSIVSVGSVWAATALCCLLNSGCGEPNALKGAKLYAVKGRVLLDDGKPLTSGQVVFVGTKSGVTSAASIESDGGFTIKSPTGDGLPEGDYKVRIEPGSTGGAKKVVGGQIKGDLPFSGHYLDEDSTDLKATVTTSEADNNFEFKLETKNRTTHSQKTSTDSRGGR